MPGLFQVHGVAEEQKVKLLTLFLGEMADVWYQGWQAQNQPQCQKEFV